MDIFVIILIFVQFSLMWASSNAYGVSKNFNVLDYGAAGNGATDDSQAFLKAWIATCNTATGIPTMIIPERRTFLVNPVVFSGPCKARSIKFLVLGTIVAPTTPSTWKGLDPSQWLAFSGVSGLNIVGSGWIDGRGSGWWNQSCRDHPHLSGCTELAPTAIKFLSCKETSLSGVHLMNSGQTHVLLLGSSWFHINNIQITAPETSPNTDGIHMQSSHHVRIQNAIIGTGDDCVSIGDYTSDIKIDHVNCGPGHGISIGSLGRGGNFVQVERIHVNNVNFKGTTNGVRIKTWQVGTGFVRGITFEHLNFTSVDNPIIIDQNYCQVRGACKELRTGVHISNVTYNRLLGTSSTDIAINLNCSRSVACTGIKLQSIQLKSVKYGQKVTSNCNNAHGIARGVIQPQSCLQK